MGHDTQNGNRRSLHENQEDLRWITYEAHFLHARTRQSAHTENVYVPKRDIKRNLQSQILNVLVKCAHTHTHKSGGNQRITVSAS